MPRGVYDRSAKKGAAKAAPATKKITSKPGPKSRKFRPASDSIGLSGSVGEASGGNATFQDINKLNALTSTAVQLVQIASVNGKNEKLASVINETLDRISAVAERLEPIRGGNDEGGESIETPRANRKNQQAAFTPVANAQSQANQQATFIPAPPATPQA
jgi:hypothetical protein